MPILTKEGANWTVVDPHVKEFRWNGKLVKTKELHEIKIEEADLVLITTNHSAFDFEMVVERAKMIFDQEIQSRKRTTTIKNRNLL